MGTSHCYEIGGDYPPAPAYPQGFLGADFAWDDARGAWRIVHIVKGDTWDPARTSPFNSPGINVEPGDFLLAVDGVPLDLEMTPDRILVNKAGVEIVVLVEDEDGGRREVTVRPLSGDMPARLQEWVARSTAMVHEKTGGRVGYIYVSDMGPSGYAEFHRAFMVEAERDALIVDVRNNSGGHVSQMLLEKLSKKRLGYDLARWGKWSPIPRKSILGPIVALTDEFSGSDGDIFSHTFKMMGLGLLIGKRTWGGIVGLNPTHPLVDGTVTTQPEFYNWFYDVGYELENRGAEPDIVVEMRPQDYARGLDPQLERAIGEITRLLREHPPVVPDFAGQPGRRPGPLPKRR
ncbi:PDZ domain-containing protein, partial [bacterium]|nr:PDZ domain-containing protein [candidate division CSSED10-310 bacterium]